jgi:hypothetical protein
VEKLIKKREVKMLPGKKAYYANTETPESEQKDGFKGKFYYSFAFGKSVFNVHEDDDFINAVEELRIEQLLERFLQRLFHVAVLMLLERLLAEAEDAFALDFTGADVGGHDQDGVFEIDFPSVRIGKKAVVKHLEQDMEHIGVRLFNLIEQYNGIGLSAHFLG